MVLPKDGEVQLFQVVDTDGNPARVSLIAGVYRLAVDALLVGPAGAYAQGDFDSVAVNEANALAMWVRSAVTALDSSQVAGSQNVPVASRAAVAAQAYTLQRLLVDGVIRGDDGAAYSAVAVRNFDANADADAALIGIVSNARLSIFDDQSGNIWKRLTGASVASLSGASLASVMVNANTVQFGVNNTGAAVLRPVEARDLVYSTGYGSALIGLWANARLVAWRENSAVYQALNGDGLATVDSGKATANVPNSLYVNAYTCGRDSTGASTLRPVEARALSGWDGSAATLIALGTAAILHARSIAGASYDAINSDPASSVSGRLATAVEAVYANALATGVDNTGAAVLRPVEARDFATISASGDVATTLIGLLVNSRGATFDERIGDWVGLMGTSYTSVAGTAAEASIGNFVYQPRESAFPASRRGRRFYTTHQTPDTVVTGQTSFVATTPTFMLRQNATSVRVILRSITLHQTGTVAGGEVKITVAIDTADRFSAGGTGVTPQNTNEESATASGITSFLTNPTASAAGAGTRYLVNTGMAASIGSKLTIDFKDGILLSATSSLLVYTWAATTGPSWFFTFEWEEVA